MIRSLQNNEFIYIYNLYFKFIWIKAFIVYIIIDKPKREAYVARSVRKAIWCEYYRKGAENQNIKANNTRKITHKKKKTGSIITWIWIPEHSTFYNLALQSLQPSPSCKVYCISFDMTRESAMNRHQNLLVFLTSDLIGAPYPVVSLAAVLRVVTLSLSPH